MVLRRTSPFGEAETTRSSLHEVDGLLYDFDVDGDYLKREHREWLDGHAVQFLSNGGSITLVGLTSRSGTPNHNDALARRRINSVVRYLISPRAVGNTNFRFREITESGERRAHRDGLPDGDEPDYSEAAQVRYRAVRVRVWDSPDPPPPPPPPPPEPSPRPRGARAFKIRVVSGTVRSLRFGMEHDFTFDVWDYRGDPQQRSIAVYRYRGDNVSMPEKGIVNFGTGSRWTRFPSPEPMDVNRLASERARLHVRSKGNFYELTLRAFIPFPSGRIWRIDAEEIVPGPTTDEGGSGDGNPRGHRSPPNPFDLLTGFTGGELDFMRQGRPSPSVRPRSTSTTAFAPGVLQRADRIDDTRPPELGRLRPPRLASIDYLTPFDLGRLRRPGPTGIDYPTPSELGGRRRPGPTDIA